MIKKFDDLCGPVKNVMYERFVYQGRRDQGADEPFALYMQDIRMRGTHCEFDKLTTEQVHRDKAIFGMYDKGLQRKLLNKKDMTIVELMEITRASDATKSSWKSMNADEESVGISKIQHGGGGGGKAASGWSGVGQQDGGWSGGRQDGGGRYRQGVQSQQGGKKRAEFDCKKCGRKHGQSRCPAFHLKCHKYNKVGHFARGCNVDVKMIDRQEATGDIYEHQINNVNKCDADLFIGQVVLDTPDVPEVGPLDPTWRPIMTTNTMSTMRD